MQSLSQVRIDRRRANFGVQQLPLFNRLKPESEIGASLLNFQGIRRLNTTKTQKFALRRTNIYAFWYYYFFYSFFFCKGFWYIEKRMRLNKRLRRLEMQTDRSLERAYFNKLHRR